MNFRDIAVKYGSAPFSRHLILEMFKDYKRPNDKINELIKTGELVAVRRGLYIPGPKADLPLPEPFLIANHLRGPSYVSLESALSYWNLIPERVPEISSVTTKTSKKYSTPIGRFTYLYLEAPYYSFGIRSVQLAAGQTAMMASQEKAVCDTVVSTSGITLRSTRQARGFLLEDLRMNEDVLRTLNTSVIRSWLDDAPKKNSLKIVAETLDAL